MFKAIKYFSTTLLALAVIVLILPYFIKLNSYKTEISQKALEVIGRDVTVEGDIKFSILPRPFLKLTDLKVSSLKGAQEPIMASLKEVEVVVAILPLLSGKIEVSKVILDKPSIVLEKLPSDDARARKLCELNIIEQVRNVAESTIVIGAWKEKRPLAVHGWAYGLEDGLLRDILKNPVTLA